VIRAGLSLVLVHLLEESLMGGGGLVVVCPKRGHKPVDPVAKIFQSSVGIVRGLDEEMDLSLRSRHTDPQHVQIILADLHVVLLVLQTLDNCVEGRARLLLIFNHAIDLESGIRFVIIEELSQTTLALSSFISAQRLVPTALAYLTDNIT
jgi:hypothetical protein